MEIDDREFQQGLQKTETVVTQAQRKGLSDCAVTLLTLSQNKVPLDKSPLLQSGGWELEDDESVAVFYAIEYAAYQHEGMRADGTRQVHNYTSPGRGPKFLEGPLHENIGTFMSYIESAIKTVL